MNGPSFFGCDFINGSELSGDPKEIDNKYSSGIYSFGSQFYVDHYCTDPDIVPCAEYKPSTFSGLNYGIKALGIESVRTVSVSHTNFIDNLTGIYLGGINNATITNNNFEIAEADTSFYTIFGGLYLDYCSGYTVEENFFTKGNLPENDKTFLFGMVVKDSGDDPNEIYNNIFTNVDVGIESLNHNRGESNREGLVIKCNEFNNQTRYNIVVTRENDTIEPAGVAYYQGSNDDVTAPAGNLFWINQWGYVHHYINELDRYPIIDTMHDPSSNIRVKPVNYTESTVTLDSTVHIYSKELACPSHLSDSSTIPDVLKSEIYVMEASIDSVQTELSIWIDGGETEVTINDIELSTPPEAYDVYSDLMLKSPYLSDTVMIESIEKENVINNSMIEDILVANPQAAKSYKIAEALDGKSYPLADEQRDNINQGKFTTSNKEKLEAKLSTRIHSKTMIQDDLITFYMNDTVNVWAIDSLEVFLSEINTLSSNYQHASLKMIQGDSLLVMAILDNFENLFEMSSRELSTHQQYISYSVLFLNNLVTEVWNNNLDSLTKLELATLSSHRSLPGRYALNILQLYDTLQYFEPYVLPQDLMKSLAIGSKPTSDDSQSQEVFKIYPNPAISYFVLEFNQGFVSQDEASFIICDELGRTIQEYLIDSESDHKVISTSSLGKGIFLCKFVRGKKVVQTVKLIVL